MSDNIPFVENPIIFHHLSLTTLLVSARKNKQTNRRLGNGKSCALVRALSVVVMSSDCQRRVRLYFQMSLSVCCVSETFWYTGAAFYGKRKSNFYGESDRMKKQSPTTPDPLEDYQGPSQAGYFQWQRDEDGQMRVS